jgi:hypothetical protein
MKPNVWALFVFEDRVILHTVVTQADRGAGWKGTRVFLDLTVT